MKKYIALLRGINVSGHRIIPMSELKKILSEGSSKDNFELKNVITYIQSGNVIFEAGEKISTHNLKLEIEKRIHKKFGFEVDVLIKSFGEWLKVEKSNPFLKREGIDVKKLYVTFLYSTPAKDKLEEFEKVNFPPEEFTIKGNEIYFYYPDGYGRAKIINPLIERKLKVTATTRNWNTVEKLRKLCRKK